MVLENRIPHLCQANSRSLQSIHLNLHSTGTMETILHPTHPQATSSSNQIPSDYRPISITSILSRTLERIIVSTFFYPILRNPPSFFTFTDQFAFRPTGSTTAAVISLLQTVSDILQTQPFVRVIALDLSLARRSTPCVTPHCFQRSPS